jgi:hypothetical protein
MIGPLLRSKQHSSFDNLVGAGEQQGRDGQSKCLGGDQADDEIELGWLLDRQVGRLRPTQNLVDVLGGAPKQRREVCSIGYKTARFDMLAETNIVGSCAPTAKMPSRFRLVATSGSLTT